MDSPEECRRRWAERETRAPAMAAIGSDLVVTQFGTVVRASECEELGIGRGRGRGRGVAVRELTQTGGRDSGHHILLLWRYTILLSPRSAHPLWPFLLFLFFSGKLWFLFGYSERNMSPEFFFSGLPGKTHKIPRRELENQPRRTT